jgi:hypothetical protein
MTLEEFYNQIRTFESTFENRELEEYLLALYKNLSDNKVVYIQERPTLELVLCLLKESFTSEATSFDDDWLNIVELPDPNRLTRKFTNPDIKDVIDKANTSGLFGMEFTMEVLKFQIAELHRMRGKQLENEDRYFGIDSDTGCRWYNFDPFSNLECGAACMVDNEKETADIDWSFIGNLLEDGRIYE